MIQGRKSVSGTGTPLADAGLQTTDKRRVSLGQSRTPLQVLNSNYDRRHTMSATNDGVAHEPVEINRRDSSSYFAGMDDDVETENFTQHNRFSLMMPLEDLPEESSVLSQNTTVNDSTQEQGQGRELEELATHLAANHNLALNNSGHLSLQSESFDLGNGYDNDDNDSRRFSIKRRSSVLSLGKCKFGLAIPGLDDEGKNEETARLSIEEVLRSFREDPTATENAIAMVSATGKLLPSDFRKFVRAFKSPIRRGTKTNNDNPRSEKDQVGVSIALRSWQEGPIGSAEEDDDEEENVNPIEQSLITDVNIIGSSTEIKSGRPSSLSCYQPWTEQELSRASDILRRASFSFSGIEATSSPSKTKYQNVPESEAESEAFSGTYTTLTSLTKELENLRTDMIKQKKEFNSKLKEKEKQTKKLNQKLEGMRAGLVYGVATTEAVVGNYNYNNDLGVTGSRTTISFTDAVNDLKNIENKRMNCEMNSIKRNINRLTELKVNITERRQARQERFDEIDEMEEDLYYHQERKFERLNHRHQNQYKVSSLASPGRSTQYGGLPPPRNNLASNSAFNKPIAKWGDSSSSSSQQHQNQDYGMMDDHDDYGGNDDADGYGNDDVNDNDVQVNYSYHSKNSTKSKKYSKSKDKSKDKHKHRDEIKDLNPKVKRTYNKKPIFKASPSAVYNGKSSNLKFLALDEDKLYDNENDNHARISDNDIVDFQDLADLEEEYRKEKRLANALKREEARRRKENGQDSDENSSSDSDSDNDRDRDEDYSSKKLKTFKTTNEKRGPGRPKGTLGISKTVKGKKVGTITGRGRGRPPKHPKTLAEGLGLPKRPRGRPPKISDEAQRTQDQLIKAASRKIAKTNKQLEAMRNGDAILSAKEVKKLENKLKKDTIAAVTAASGVIPAKRPLTSYALFCKENRAEVIATNDTAEHKCSPQEILRLLALKWGECTVEDKQLWQEKTDVINQEAIKSGTINGVQANVTSKNTIGIELEKEAWEIRAIEQRTPKKAGEANSDDDSDDSDDPFAVKRLVNKRPRGRPAKAKTANAEGDDGLPKKRARGRPKKAAVAVTTVSIEDTVNINELVALPLPVQIQEQETEVDENVVMVADVEEVDAASEDMDQDDVVPAIVIESVENQMEVENNVDEFADENEDKENQPVTAMTSVSVVAVGKDVPKNKNKKSKKEKNAAKKASSVLKVNKIEPKEVVLDVMKKQRRISSIGVSGSAIKMPKVLGELAISRNSSTNNAENIISEKPYNRSTRSKIGRMSGVGVIPPVGISADAVNSHKYFNSADNSINDSVDLNMSVETTQL